MLFRSGSKGIVAPKSTEIVPESTEIVRESTKSPERISPPNKIKNGAISLLKTVGKVMSPRSQSPPSPMKSITMSFLEPPQGGYTEKYLKDNLDELQILETCIVLYS